jgi:branched-chain amino acid transport system permease protein
VRGRPQLRTTYAQEVALFDSGTKRSMVTALVALGLATPFMLADPDLQKLALACIAAIGAIGLNLITGYAGQVSLGHAFFLAIGAYTAAAISGDPDDRTIGFGVTEILIWLPAAGVAAAPSGCAACTSRS